MNLADSRFTLWLCHAGLAILLVITLFPIALLVLDSVKPAMQIVANPLSWPAPFSWQNSLAHGRMRKSGARS